MRIRPMAGAATLVAGALLLAACSSPGRPSPSSTTTSSAPGTSHQGTTGTTSGLGATPPRARSTGPLHIRATIALPITNGDVATAEAPDGAVFVAPVTLGAAGTPVTTVVWVVDGDGPAEVAEHFAGPVTALAADAANLYVANYSAVTAFDRVTGNQSGQWTLPPTTGANASDDDLTVLAASGGAVLISIAQGNGVSVYRIDPGTPAAPQLVVQGLSAAFGPDGSIVYERSDRHLVELAATGATTVGPELADAPNSEGGGVQYVAAVAGGYAWVTEPAGQGLDASLTPFDLSTLQPRATFAGTANEEVVESNGGLLALNAPYNSAVCPGASPTSICVVRLAPSGQLTDGTVAGTALQLVGPYPAVVASDQGDTALQLERLS
jgi:hypothetical protein